MDFTPTADQVLLRDTLRGLLAKECPPALLRAHMTDPAAADPLWRHLADFSALGLGPATDLALAQAELGFVAAPGPFFATAVLLAPLLALAGRTEDEDAVIAGSLVGTVALAGADGQWVPNTEAVRSFVPDADRARRFAVVEPDRIHFFASLPHRLVETVDSTRRLFRCDVDPAAAETVAVDPAAIDDWLLRAFVALAAEMAGTARRLLTMTVAYVTERVQFDVPVGTFQAVQHRLADTALDVERAVAAVQFAAMALDADDDERARAAHVAKSTAGVAATGAAKAAIQLHGGVGYTWEHDLHLYMRRAFADEHWLGPREWHHDRLAALLID